MSLVLMSLQPFFSATQCFTMLSSLAEATFKQSIRVSTLGVKELSQIMSTAAGSKLVALTEILASTNENVHVVEISGLLQEVV